jgi:broad specificity phosphatase PhoE
MPNWADAAACKDATDIFFSDVPDDIERAKDICRACPVRAECLAETLDPDTDPRSREYGVWAGFTPAELKAIIRTARATAPSATAPV